MFHAVPGSSRRIVEALAQTEFLIGAKIIRNARKSSGVNQTQLSNRYKNARITERKAKGPPSTHEHAASDKVRVSLLPWRKLMNTASIVRRLGFALAFLSLLASQAGAQ